MNQNILCLKIIMKPLLIVIECDKAEANVIYEEPLDAAYLSRLAREEPASYVSFALKPGGLQRYVEAMVEFN
ncbi:MAG: hypothetical protein ACLSHP_08785 [Coprococcus sp.]